MDECAEDGQMVEIRDGETTWRFDSTFLTSNWTCIWGRGCQGILAEPAEHLGQGCCSIGAELDSPDEARQLSAFAAMVPLELFEFHAEAKRGGIFRDETRTNTRIVDSACIFLNRPGFSGGAGCALHLAALESNDSPIDWKPSVCWQLPIHVDWVAPAHEGDAEVATVRGWTRSDWGDDGDPMAWCCTEDEGAFIGESPVIDSLATELEAIVGSAVLVELRRRL